MKLLFDQNISYKIVDSVTETFPGSAQVRSLGLEGATDKEIWTFAKQNDFTIVTFDSDFYDYSLVWGHPPKVIWLRTLDQTTKHLTKMLKDSTVALVHFHKQTDLACLELIDKNAH